jgi:hypothetical protein
MRINLFVGLACAGLFVPISANASRAAFVGTERERTCRLHLADGQPYTLAYRTFRWRKKETEVYTGAVAFYQPGSGAFLWWGMDYTPDGYFRYGKNEPIPDCTDARRETLLLQDGEWADYLAINCSLRVFHSNLKFPSIEKAWQYVAEHPDETSSWAGGKWVASIDLYQVLGPDFFHRPEKLRYDARPYTYQPLIGVKKVGSTWELQIQGTDDQALIVLDNDFRVVKATKPVSHKD